jgi:hypothetical protein
MAKKILHPKILALIIGMGIPWIIFVVISPFLNFPEPRILGLPPLMFWDTLGIVLTSLCLFLAYLIELKGGKIE